MKLVHCTKEKTTIMDSVLGFVRVINLVTGETFDTKEQEMIDFMVANGEEAVSLSHGN